MLTYYRRSTLELLYTSNGYPYEGYQFYVGDRQKEEDVVVPNPPDTIQKWYLSSNSQWTLGPQELSFNELVLSGKISLDTAKLRLIEKVKEIAYLKTSIAFECQALGETYRYESAFIDQFNLLSNVVKAIVDDVPVEHRCIRISDNKDDFFVHTPAQMKDVFRAGYQYILDHLKRMKLLMIAIYSAQTAEDLLAIDLNSGW